jgi:hypothetical protein
VAAPGFYGAKLFHVGELTREYGFTDTDGRRVPPFLIRESFVEMVKKFEKQRVAD